MSTGLVLALLAGAAAIAAVGGRALRDLYAECGGRVMALALRILRDRHEAEDVVQETFLELWRRADAYDARLGTPATWAIVIARSRALDRVRARASAARAAEAHGREPPPDPPALEPAEARQERERVLTALAEIPPEQREVLELAYFEGLSQSAIAARTGQPLGTVKTRVRLAMDKLHARLVGMEGAA